MYKLKKSKEKHVNKFIY